MDSDAITAATEHFSNNISGIDDINKSKDLLLIATIENTIEARRSYIKPKN